MVHPELYGLIQRVNGHEVPLVSLEKMQVFIEVLLYILTLTIVPIFVYDITLAMGKMFWNLLTPGQQWLEISMIIGGIGFLILCKFITDEFTENIVKKFAYLKEQNAEMVKRIAELEEENAALKKKIKCLENKNEFLDTIHHLLEEEDEANMQNV